MTGAEDLAPLSNGGAPRPASPRASARATKRPLLWQRDLSDTEWDELLAAAERLSGAGGRRPLLAGARFGMLFLDPSLRTRTAFEVAAWDLGAHAIHLQPGAGLWQLEHRRGVVMDGVAAEHVVDAIGVLGGMVDALGVRCFSRLEDPAEDVADSTFAAIASAADVPVLNLESAADHPHQALADALTLRRHLAGERVNVVLTWAPHVKPLPRAVPQAALLAFAREGYDVTLAHPEGFELHPSTIGHARTLASRRGGSIDVTHDREAALAGANVVYAKSWGPPSHDGDAERATEAVRAHPAWKVTVADMALTRSARFMHCLPVRRGVVVDDAVLDSPASLVRAQAHARVEVQKATLCRAMGVST